MLIYHDTFRNKCLRKHTLTQDQNDNSLEAKSRDKSRIFRSQTAKMRIRHTRKKKLHATVGERWPINMQNAIGDNCWSSRRLRHGFCWFSLHPYDSQIIQLTDTKIKYDRYEHALLKAHTYAATFQIFQTEKQNYAKTRIFRIAHYTRKRAYTRRRIFRIFHEKPSIYTFSP